MIEKVRKWKFVTKNKIIILVMQKNVGLVAKAFTIKKVNGKRIVKNAKRFDGWNIYSVMRMINDFYKLKKCYSFENSGWILLDKKIILNIAYKVMKG